MLSKLLQRHPLSIFIAATARRSCLDRVLSSSAASTRQRSKKALNVDGTDEKESKPRVESRWRRLKRERREAPPPKRRSSYEFDRDTSYSVEDALVHVRKSSWAHFDESLELVLRLNVDPRHADHNLRGSFSLPFGTGRPDKVAVFVSDINGHDAKIARNAGAHLIGSDDLISEIAGNRGKSVKGFAACVAMSEMLPSLAQKAGRILGPKGLMPSAKLGTVVSNDDALKLTIKELLQGRVMYRVDKASNMHMNVGKLSFSDEMLVHNILVAVRAIWDVRPASVKRSYIKKAIICSSMGPSVQLVLESLVPRILQLDIPTDQ